MSFKILDISLDSHRLIVSAEHSHSDGTFWFAENYTWQGREGNRQSHQMLGELMLMDDGKPAPLNEHGHQHLPRGRKWAWIPGPSMIEENILQTIRLIHEQRLVSGWPQDTVDLLSTLPDEKIRQRDRDGSAALIDKFLYMKGKSYDR